MSVKFFNLPPSFETSTRLNGKEVDSDYIKLHPEKFADLPTKAEIRQFYIHFLKNNELEYNTQYIFVIEQGKISVEMKKII